MLLIIIPLVFNILFLWYIKKNLTFSNKANVIKTPPRWVIWLSILLSLIPVAGIVIGVIWIGALVGYGFEGDLSFRDTKLNKFLR